MQNKSVSPSKAGTQPLRAPEQGAIPIIATISIVATGTACTALLLWFSISNGDNAFLLDIARIIMRGGRYFHEIFEPNLPLYSLLLIPVHLLGAVARFPIYDVFVVYIGVIVTVSCLCCYPLFARALPLRPARILAICLMLETVLFLGFGADFGQRDHLAIVLILPAILWLATLQSRARVGIFGVALLVCATLGLLIKPHFLAVAGVIFLLRIVQERRLSVFFEAPVYVMVSATILYGVVFAIWFHDWLLLWPYITHVYWVYYRAAPVLWPGIASFVVILILAAWNEAIPLSDSARRLSRYLAAASVGFIIEIIAQNKGYSYHLVPPKVTIGLLFGLAVLGAAAAVGKRWHAAARIWPELVLALALLPVVFRSMDRAVFEAGREQRLLAHISLSLADSNISGKIYIASPVPNPTYPFIASRGVAFGVRFPQLWLLQWLNSQRALSPPRDPLFDKFEAEFVTMLADDLEKWQPDAIMVDDRETKWYSGDEGKFDFMAWCRSVPRLARIVDQFTFVTEIREPPNAVRQHLIYRVYIRKQ